MVLHVLAWDARMVPVDLAYVIFIDFLALGVLRFCFLLLSNVQFLVLVNLPPGLATRVGGATPSRDTTYLAKLSSTIAAIIWGLHRHANKVVSCGWGGPW